MSAVYYGVSIEPLIYGQHDGRGNFYYQAECQACWLRCCGVSADIARFHHLIHCAKKHLYVFEEDYPLQVTAENASLQDAISLAMTYDLPMPGFDSHKNCLMQIRQGVKVCVLHDMRGTYSLLGRRHWLGYL